MTGGSSTKTYPLWRGWTAVLRRVVTTLTAAALIGLLMHALLGALSRGDQPAGFVRGLLQGALMPGALPNLLVGNNVVIYSARNTGLTYKLGYTCGVNGCGAVFFGIFFWRLNRWRKRANGSVPANRSAPAEPDARATPPR